MTANLPSRHATPTRANADAVGELRAILVGDPKFATYYYPTAKAKQKRMNL
jgi:hypothetical protein